MLAAPDGDKMDVQNTLVTVDELFAELFDDDGAHPALKTHADDTETKQIGADPITPLAALFQERGIRIMGTVDEPTFVATDVAKHIEDVNNSRTFRKKMTDEYIQMGPACNSRGEIRIVHFLTEAGIYRYLLQSKKPLAEEFQLFTYDLLTKERKRTVDGARLALKIEKTKREALQRENAVISAVRRDGRIELTHVMRTANIARDQRRRVQKQIRAFWKEAAPGHGEGPRHDSDSESDEYEVASGDEVDIRRRSRPLPPPRDPSDGTSERELMTPLVALFEEKKIRILGTVTEPFFCASDVADYIKDENAPRIFLKQTPEVYVRWVQAYDAQGQLRPTRYLTEAGTYRYLLRSTLPGAEPFQVLLMIYLRPSASALLIVFSSHLRSNVPVSKS
jgi:prophage antirepressor-like protein